jgi:2-phosphoglycolate phosphatase
MRDIKAILFDLDGTLLDSAPDLIEALNWLRGQEGLAPLDTLAMSRYVSHGAHGILTAGMPAASEVRFAEWKSLFLQRYAAVGYCQSRLYPGISAVLSHLRMKQIPWGIVTNKSAALTLPILKSIGLDSEVGCVVCGDTLQHSKPHPAPVLHACAQLGIQPSDTLFAGDDVRDIQAGRRAGTMTAAILYGYGSFEFDVALLAQNMKISRPEEFLQLLA